MCTVEREWAHGHRAVIGREFGRELNEEKNYDSLSVALLLFLLKKQRWGRWRRLFPYLE